MGFPGSLEMEQPAPSGIAQNVIDQGPDQRAGENRTPVQVAFGRKSGRAADPDAEQSDQGHQESDDDGLLPDREHPKSWIDLQHDEHCDGERQRGLPEQLVLQYVDEKSCE